MPYCDRLNALHAEYRALSETGPRWPTDDVVESLRYFKADIAYASGEIPERPNGRVATWIRNVRALEEFIETTGHFPHDNRRRPVSTFTVEHVRLISWVGTQRRATVSGLRCTYQLRRLSVVEGYDQFSLEAKWTRMLDQYRAWLDVSGVPRFRSASAEERSLASWAAKQRMAFRRGLLDSERIERLENLRIWIWGH